MIEAGGYSLHIRCDSGHDARRPGLTPQQVGEEIDRGKTWQYAGHDKVDCLRQARRAGWLFRRNGRTYCPACRKSRRRE